MTAKSYSEAMKMAATLENKGYVMCHYCPDIDAWEEGWAIGLKSPNGEETVTIYME